MQGGPDSWWKTEVLNSSHLLIFSSTLTLIASSESVALAKVDH